MITPVTRDIIQLRRTIKRTMNHIILVRREHGSIAIFRLLSNFVYTMADSRFMNIFCWQDTLISLKRFNTSSKKCNLAGNYFKENILLN